MVKLIMLNIGAEAFNSDFLCLKCKSFLENFILEKNKNLSIQGIKFYNLKLKLLLIFKR